MSHFRGGKFITVDVDDLPNWRFYFFPKGPFRNPDGDFKEEALIVGELLRIPSSLTRIEYDFDVCASLGKELLSNDVSSQVIPSQYSGEHMNSWIGPWNLIGTLRISLKATITAVETDKLKKIWISISRMPESPETISDSSLEKAISDFIKIANATAVTKISCAILVLVVAICSALYLA